MQHGVDALLLPLMKNCGMLQRRFLERTPVQLEERKDAPSLVMANVTNVESGGVGERVCIDLTERLIEREGMLIGSSANALVLIHGETIL